MEISESRPSLFDASSTPNFLFIPSPAWTKANELADVSFNDDHTTAALLYALGCFRYDESGNITCLVPSSTKIAALTFIFAWATLISTAQIVPIKRGTSRASNPVTIFVFPAPRLQLLSLYILQVSIHTRHLVPRTPLEYSLYFP